MTNPADAQRAQARETARTIAEQATTLAAQLALDADTGELNETQARFNRFKPLIEAALTAARAEAEAERDTLREALEKFGQHALNCKHTNPFAAIPTNCTACYGRGVVPSDDCDECPDCTMPCRACGGKRATPAPCNCGLAAALKEPR